MITSFSNAQEKRDAYRLVLQQLTPEIDAAPDEAAVYYRVLDALDRLPTFDWTGIYLLANADTLRLGPYRGEPTEHLEIPVGRGICGQSAARGATVVVADVAAEANYLACSLNTRSEIVVPIRVGGVYHAQIDVDSHTPAAFDAVDREALETLAESIGTRLAGLGVRSAASNASQ